MGAATDDPKPGGPVLHARLASAVLLLSMLPAPWPGSVPLAGQVEPPAPGVLPDSLPADTWGSEGARSLVARAVAVRGLEVEGIESYEALMRQRIYVGLAGPTFRRERALFEQEGAARIRWQRDGERAVMWLGARRAVPIVGAVPSVGGEAGDEVAREIQRELESELPDETEPLGFSLDPWDDRLVFGNATALHPLADSALARYRYSLGDTLSLSLPDGRRVEMVEVVVQPREADPELVAGSLWFDRSTAQLVRATYKPARPFDLELDAPDDAEDVPGFLKPVTAEVEYVTVEYSLHELRYWLPRRFALQSEAGVGRFFDVPLTIEWTVRDYRVNEADSEIPVTGALPPGWTRSERRIETEEGGDRFVTVIVPPADSLLRPEWVTGEAGDRDPVAFRDEEIREIRSELQALVPAYAPLRPRLAWGLREGLVRYNRVEGLSAGARASMFLAPELRLSAVARVGVADLDPRGELRLERGTDRRGEWLAGYSRLAPVGDFESPFSLGASVQNLLLGSDRTHYYQVAGGEVGLRRSGTGASVRVRAFAEGHARVVQNTDFFLLEPVRDVERRPLAPVTPGWIAGLGGTLRWQRGLDPGGLIASGTVGAELAEPLQEDRELSYRRLMATVAVAHPLPGGLAGALELGAGGLWGDAPPQKGFRLGGARSLRGFDSGELGGEAFWMARAEVANRFAGARLSLFTDLGWAGPRGDFGTAGYAQSVGVGASILDGIFRFDVAKGVRNGTGWEVHAYLDGLF